MDVKFSFGSDWPRICNSGMSRKLREIEQSRYFDSLPVGTLGDCESFLVEEVEKGLEGGGVKADMEDCCKVMVPPAGQLAETTSLGSIFAGPKPQGFLGSFLLWLQSRLNSCY